MTIGELRSESFGTCLLLLLPQDVFASIPRFLSPSDVCNLSLCCKSLYDHVLAHSENIWLAQCELVKVLPMSEIVQWRIGISSYKTLCRFLVEVMKPLIGVWVHQVPELGNVVYVMPGFLSVVGCRIIPQEGGPLGIQEGRVMWSPVFEIISDFDGSTKFFLHGRGREGNCVYPGSITGTIEKSCNVISLEVEKKNKRQDKSGLPFQELGGSDRLNLLELVTGHVGLNLPEPLSINIVLTTKEDEGMLLERRTMLLKMHKFGRYWKHMNLEEDELCYNLTHADLSKKWRKLNAYYPQSFFTSGDTFGLSLKTSYTDESSYRKWPGWPNMKLGRFCLHKLPFKKPTDDQEYAGLWGGTFGWPPSKCIDDETGKAFYLLMLTYEEDNERRLIGTKILEGTHYAKRPNGSSMFVVNIDTPSLEPFLFDADGIDFEHSYTGMGIASGYGFRGPGFVPGSLHVISDDHLAFVWHETKNVFTLKRLNLEEVLKKGLGLCVPPLPPTKNFMYSGMSYTNAYTES